MPRTPHPQPDQAAPLLRLAADIARAGRNSKGWPEIFRQLGDSLDCPDLFGGGDRSNPNRLTTTAAACARRATGRCGCGPLADENKRQTCLALIELLELALAPAQILPRHFDDFPRPLFLIDVDAYLRETNVEGRRVLEEGRWLVRQGEVLSLATGLAQRALMGMLKTMHRRNDQESVCQRLVTADGERAELWARPLQRDSDTESDFLLSLVIDMAPAVSASLSPRQSELAGHLLIGRTLNQAADAMGITRRTAKDHLTSLFKVSDTRRQSDLVVWLTRRHLA